MKRILFLLFLLSTALSTINAQDKKFWFSASSTSATAVPQDNGGFFFSNSTNSPAEVTIKYYKTNFTETITVPARAGYAHILSGSFIVNNIIAPYTGDVSNCGVSITSTEEVSAYFHWNQYAYQYIAVLKGRAALGKEFYVTQVSDRWITTEGGYDNICIVAPEDNTTVSFKPTRDCYGTSGTYFAGTTYTKTLNAGQTLAFRELNINSGGVGSFSSLAGTYITSNKDVAVTSCESVNHDPACDQIIPVNRLGTDYVIVKGFSAIANGERTYITATENDTKVYTTPEGGTQALLATLNAGQTAVYNMKDKTMPPYVLSIHADKPVSVMQYADCNQSNGNGHTDGAVVPNLDNLSIGDYSFFNMFSASDVYNAILTVYRKGSRENFSITYAGNTYSLSSPNSGSVVRYGDVPGHPHLEYMQWQLPQASRGMLVNVNNSTSSYTLGYYSASIATFYTTFGYFSTFSSARQDVCIGEVPEVLINKIAMTGTVTYQWEFSPDSGHWEIVAGATGSTFTPPSQKKEGSYYYRVKVTNGTDNVYGPPVEIVVKPCVLPVNPNIHLY